MTAPMQEGRVLADAFAPVGKPASCNGVWSAFTDSRGLDADAPPSADAISSTAFNATELAAAMLRARVCTVDSRAAMLAALEANCQGVPAGVYSKITAALGPEMYEQIVLRRLIVDARPTNGCYESPGMLRGASLLMFSVNGAVVRAADCRPYIIPYNVMCLSTTSPAPFLTTAWYVMPCRIPEV